MTKIISKNVVDSTNEEAKRFINDTEMDNFILISDIQTNAKCRYERDWLTPGQNIAFTLAIPCPKESTSLLPFYLTTQSLLRRGMYHLITKRGREIKIKWPNDIFVDDKKISGTHIEYYKEILLIGVDINYNLQGKKLGFRATDIKSCNGSAQAYEVIRNVVSMLDLQSALFNGPEALEWIRSAYEMEMKGYGEIIDIYLDADKETMVSGRCMGVDSMGKIILHHDDDTINSWSVYDAAIKE